MGTHHGVPERAAPVREFAPLDPDQGNYAARGYLSRMDNRLRPESAGAGRREDLMGDAQLLRKQAEWCVDMAARALTPTLFEKYVALAADLARRAADRQSTPG